MDAERSDNLNEVNLEEGNEKIEKTEELDQVLLDVSIGDKNEKDEKDDGLFILVCTYLCLCEHSCVCNHILLLLM
jgi:hypothetical protein